MAQLLISGLRACTSKCIDSIIGVEKNYNGQCANSANKMLYLAVPILLFMKTEYTLHPKNAPLQKAQSYATSQGFGLDELLEGYIRFLALKEERRDASKTELHSFMDELHSEFELTLDPDAKKDYRRYLVDKYR